ncbi:MAG: NAD(P)(+) transhydrogenase (Re/Si-specific) subunit alpha, partial [Ignavibacteria bacterium]
MNIGVIKEPSHETRVSLLPEAVASLTSKGHTIFVESQAGALAFASDEDYVKAGATIAHGQQVIESSDILLSIHPEPVIDVHSKTIIGVYYPLFNPKSTEIFASNGNTVFSLD